MKILVSLCLLGFMSLTTLIAGTEPIKDVKEPTTLCKLFQKKALTYKKTMRDDDYARATLASYKKRAAIFCAKGK